MKKTIAVLPGDGVGPEVTREAIKILKKVAEKFDHLFVFKEGLIGAVAITQTGDPFPKETRDLCVSVDAILFGAIGDPKFDHDPQAKLRPEQGLLRMRKCLGLYANIRPIKPFPQKSATSPLKKEIIEGVDFVIVRELTSGIYFGKRGRLNKGSGAYDTCQYTKEEILSVARFAFDLAKKRKNKVTLVDKANVLETSRLWRQTVQELSHEYPTVNVDYMFVDNAAMQIIKNPKQFDVLLTENMFGDILSDEASVIVGSIGMLPSASIGKRVSLYEPIHGSFPKAAGQNRANPIGAILSAGMLLEYSFGLHKEKKAIENAVEETLKSGDHPLTTSELGNKIESLI